VTGADLANADFAFQHAAIPPAIKIGSVAVGSSGTSGILSLLVALGASGSFIMTASNTAQEFQI
jgi:hypothetical protein